MSKNVRMLVYRYLKLQELLKVISLLSRQERNSLQNSHIINENRMWVCKYWHANVRQIRGCLLQEDRLANSLRKVKFLLNMVERINIRVDPEINMNFLKAARKDPIFG